MQVKSIKTLYPSLAILAMFPLSGIAGEPLFGKVKTAEPLPENAQELYFKINRRDDKGEGHYTAYDYSLDYEYGVTDSFTLSTGIKGMSLDTSGLLIEGYLPKEEDFSFMTTGVEVGFAYNFLKPALDDFGLSVSVDFDYAWVDPHSGQDKDTASVDLGLQLQKYFMDGQLVWAGNANLETTWADRGEIDDLPEYFEWPTDPEMEIELGFSTGLSYRFAPNWFAGVEVQYEEEYETEVNRERWSWFGGPNIHYGGEKFWATLSWLEQFSGGGESYPGQTEDLHLIEKTQSEMMLQVGMNF